MGFEKINQKSMKYFKPAFIVMTTMFCFTLLSCSNDKEQRIRTTGREKVDFSVLTFPIEDVKLLDGPFLFATKLDEQTLLNYEPDRLLANFRKEAGLQPKAEHYHGWEDNTIAGHSLGHYLSAISQMYKTTGNEEFLRRVNYIVDELDECQRADGEGYIGAFPNGKKILEQEVAKGNIRSEGFNLNGIWVPFYTEHKVMDGLFHAYKECGNKKALEINIKFAKWLERIVKNLNDEQIQLMLNCEHGGINEALAELYAQTGEEEFLKLSQVFYHKAILDSLAHGVDILPGKHANTQIPKLIGLARLYELTGSEKDYKATEFFWNRVVYHHSYVTGGNGNHEYFGPADSLNERLSNETTESCNVYNMLKLSEHLFEWDAKPEVADFYERALFNHILSSQNPVDGRVIYNLSLEMGGVKEYQDPYWFTCCVGTGMENHSKYSKNIYYYNNDALYVGQFIASELNWKAKGVKVIQQTNYPDEQGTTLKIVCDNSTKFILKVRYPAWAKQGIGIKINGKVKKVNAQPGSFVMVGDKWKNGDQIEVSLPFSLHLESMPDNGKRVAVLYGPLVLAGDLGPEVDPLSNDPMYVPILMTKDKKPEDWLIKVPGQSNTFKTQSIGRPRDITLSPFYKFHDRHYTVYWDMYNEEEWKAYQNEYAAEIQKVKELDARTVDLFRLGEMQPERDHHFDGSLVWNGELKSKKFREVDRGGWMSFQMKNNKRKSVTLVLEYWGGYSGSKTFDILIENHLIATENITKIEKSKFIDVEYAIPENLIANKDFITIKIVPQKGHRAGPVFSARIINN
jgi:uncharacterized protein